MPYAVDFVRLCNDQAGERYVYGAEVSLSDPNPPGPWDCSELVQWAAHRLGVRPTVPDGSWNQMNHCRAHGSLVPIEQAIRTPGALLFTQTSSTRHVAVSRGDGSTIEARGSAYGVGHWPSRGRPWTHAGLIPGLSYDDPPPVPAPTPQTSAPHPTPTVRKGSRGSAVAEVQRHLNRHGARPVLMVDGDFGPITDRAVRVFQQRRGLVIDGIVGPRTWAALHS